MPPRLRVLVTGATSGLGREMAVLLAGRGARLALTGRRVEKLAEAARAVEQAGGEALVLPGDAADLEHVRRDYAAIQERWGGLDWAILNAGVSRSMHAREFSAEAFREVLDVNVMGVVYWLEAVLPGMIAAGSGTVAGIASLAAFRGLPRAGPYCASKAALVTLLESARVDLRGTGVKVVTVCPGYVKSEMTDKHGRPMPFLLETEDGARRMLAGIERGDRLVHFPWQLSWPMVYLMPVIPSALYEWLVSWAAPTRAKAGRPD